MFQDVTYFDSTRFNNLPDIEIANATMKANDQLSLACSTLGPVFIKHHMCDSWGIVLLHNHWTVGDEELPIQDVVNSGSPREYETSPKTTSFPKKYWPSILAMKQGSNSTLEPIEFSTECRVEGANEALDRNPEFVRDFCNTLVNNDLASTFGLIVPKETSKDGLEFVEFNEERLSLLIETVSAENDPKQLIETSWRFAPSEVAGKCEKSCFVTCTVSGSSHTKKHNALHKP